MSHYAYVCRRCDHFASVHRGFDQYACRMCDCVSSDQNDFELGIDERAARMNHQPEMAFLAAESQPSPVVCPPVSGGDGRG